MRREIDQTAAGEQLSSEALRHVASCAACAAFQNERARLRELLTSLEPVAAPADFDFRLRARIAARTERSAPRSFLAGFVLSTPAIAVATVVVLVLGLSILWMSQRSANQAPTIATNSSKQAGEGKSKTVDNSTPRDKEQTPPPIANGGNGGKEEVVYQPRAGRQPQIKVRRMTQPGGSSSDFSALGAESIKQGQNAGDVSVSAPLNPMVLSFQDEKGATRTVSLPPVSFGSQRLLEGRVVPVSLKNGRVW